MQKAPLSGMVEKTECGVKEYEVREYVFKVLLCWGIKWKTRSLSLKGFISLGGDFQTDSAFITKRYGGKKYRTKK